MAGFDAALRAPRDSLAVSFARNVPPPPPPQQAAAPRATVPSPAATAGTATAVQTPTLAIDAVKATMAADRATFAAMSSGRQHLVNQGAVATRAALGTAGLAVVLSTAARPAPASSPMVARAERVYAAPREHEDSRTPSR